MRLALCVSVSCAAWATPVRAETISVPRDFPTIQQAIDAAVDGDQVVVTPGVYPEHVDLLGKAIMLRSTAPGDPAIVATTIIFGGNDADAPGFPQNPGPVVTCTSGEDASTLVLGLTIAGGGTLATPGAGMRIVGATPTVARCRFVENTVINGDGGGVYAEDSDAAFLYCDFLGNVTSVESGAAMSLVGGAPSLLGCLFRENAAGNDGGALHLFDSSPVVVECTFESNRSDDRGGGVYAFDSADQTTAAFVDCRFVGNESGLGSPSGHGGGLFVGVGASLVSGCEFVGNTAPSGGGLHANRVLTGVCSVTGCLFDGNVAQEAGGGMNISGLAAMTVSRCVFRENHSENRGGGLASSISGLRVFNCEFHANTASVGGAVLETGISLFSATFANCLLVRNAAAQGGAIAIRGSGGSAGVSNCTFAENAATLGGAMHLDLPPGVSVAVRNTIFWENTASIGPVGWVGAQSTLDVAYSSVAGGEAAVVEAGGIVTWGAGNISGDPSFVDPDGPDDDPATTGDNDYRPSPSSPCIDAASNLDLPPDSADLDDDGDTTEPLPFGVDGQPRFVDDPGAPDTGLPDGVNPIVDIGSYEFQFVPDPCPADITGDGQVGVQDVVEIVLGWGACPAPPVTCPADLNGDGEVNVQDLVQIVVSWGPCR